MKSYAIAGVIGLVAFGVGMIAYNKSATVKKVLGGA